MGAFGLAVIQKPLLEERGTACGGVVVERDVEAPPLLLISIFRATDDRPYEAHVKYISQTINTKKGVSDWKHLLKFKIL